jgi:hypothetical protein
MTQAKILPVAHLCTQDSVPVHATSVTRKQGDSPVVPVIAPSKRSEMKQEKKQNEPKKSRASCCSHFGVVLDHDLAVTIYFANDSNLMKGM